MQAHGDPLLTVKQLASYLSVNERTVLKLVADGTLPGVKVGNQWRFRKAMIDTWLDDQMIGVTPKYIEPPIRPFMVLGRCSPGIDFDALDGEPTHLFFVLGLKYAELHLPWLQKLSQILIDRGRVQALLAASDAAAIYHVLSEAERSLSPIAFASAP